MYEPQGNIALIKWEKTMLAFRLLSAVQFLGGCFFAAFAWVLILTPLGIFQPRYQYTMSDALLSLGVCALSLSGYIVWIGWIYLAISGRFLLKRPLLMQSIAIGNHLGWLVFFPAMNHDNLAGFYAHNPTLVMWIVGNLCIAVVVLIYFCVVRVRERSSQRNV